VPVGSPCSSNDGCKSGDCVSFNYATAGLCSQPCSTDTDCGSGMACVACAGCAAAAGLDGGTDAGPTGQCFPTCVNGATCFVPSQCNSLARAGGGGSVNVCDPHLADGAMCTRGTDCTSGRCGSGGTCIPSSGIATGKPCTKSPSDCSSGQCCNSNCC
jgi:hypothetical protein